MDAVFFKQPGGAEVLEYGEIPTPQPGAGEVLVRLEAAALNHMDLFVRQGLHGLTPKLPHILGADGAGRVAAVGEGVSDWQAGKKVVINASICLTKDEFTESGQENLCRSWELLGETLPGTYAQYVVVPQENLLACPEAFPSEKAAAAAMVYLTAWHSLATKGHLEPGETVLVVGSSGGVNSASIQIAKYLGATVIAVGSNEAKLQLAESLGADYLINRSKEDWSGAAYRITNKRGVDVVVDNIGSTFPLSMRAARKGGRILNVGRTGAATVEINLGYIFGKHLSIIGSTMGTHADFTEVMKLVFEGKLLPVMDYCFPLNEARAAHERLEAGQQLGKITLQID
ncbi:MAG: zinc-binding dehydrogenase [Chloroflexi bacterium]|nr:zinc-binding dehydrogenase [Chloroflexota bacterium]